MMREKDELKAHDYRVRIWRSDELSNPEERVRTQRQASQRREETSMRKNTHLRDELKDEKNSQDPTGVLGTFAEPNRNRRASTHRSPLAHIPLEQLFSGRGNLLLYQECAASSSLPNDPFAFALDDPRQAKDAAGPGYAPCACSTTAV